MGSSECNDALTSLVRSRPRVSRTSAAVIAVTTAAAHRYTDTGVDDS
nr:hypothetical protein [Glycomyces terrestris]